MNGSIGNPELTEISTFALAELGDTDVRRVLRGGVIAGALDATNGVVAFALVLGMNPIQVLQYIASGVLGASSFTGGLPTAALGALLHFFIAFVAAGFYVAASRWFKVLSERFVLCGAVYGVAVFAFMNYVVLPFSAVPKSEFSTVLFLNGVIGHALLVGLPIAWAARRSTTVRRSGVQCASNSGS